MRLREIRHLTETSILASNEAQNCCNFVAKVVKVALTQRLACNFCRSNFQLRRSNASLRQKLHQINRSQGLIFSVVLQLTIKGLFIWCNFCRNIASFKLKIAATEIACYTLRGRYCLYFCNKVATVEHFIGCQDWTGGICNICQIHGFNYSKKLFINFTKKNFSPKSLLEFQNNREVKAPIDKKKCFFDETHQLLKIWLKHKL